MTPPSNDPSTKLPLTAAILAGGRSRRMGLDKALLTIGGRTLMGRVEDAVEQVCEHVIVVTNRPDTLSAAGLGADVRIVTEEVPDLGPLGGLVAALEAAEDEWILAVAADMPWIVPDVVRLLWERREGVDVVVPVGDDGREPLLALYSCRALATAQRLLESGARRPVQLIDAVPNAEITLDELRAADPELLSLRNVNTPEELAEAQRSHTPPRHGRTITVKTLPAAPRESGTLPVERQVTIYAGGNEIATTQATPAELDEMAVGFLVSEGFLGDRDALESVEVDRRRGLVWVHTAENIEASGESRTRYFTSGCGKGVTFASVGHARDLAPVTGGPVVTAEDIAAMQEEMDHTSANRIRSGGMHSCGLATGGAVMIVREDIGRHNALDKVLGRAWLDRIPTDNAVLLTTGRISYEMVIKAARSRIPIVASRKAITDLAAEIGDALGVTLVGYVRGGSMTVYTHPERIEGALGADRQS